MKRSYPDKIRFFLTKNRDKFPLPLHAFLIKHRWVENRGITYKEDITLTEEDPRHTIFPDEAEAHRKEQARKEIWTTITNCMKHGFYPEHIEIEVMTDFNDISRKFLAVRVDMSYRKPYSLSEMRLLVQKLGSF